MAIDKVGMEFASMPSTTFEKVRGIYTSTFSSNSYIWRVLPNKKGGREKAVKIDSR